MLFTAFNVSSRAYYHNVTMHYILTYKSIDNLSMCPNCLALIISDAPTPVPRVKHSEIDMLTPPNATQSSAQNDW